MILIRAYSDLQLIALLKKGDEKAFDELFRRYWTKAYKVAFGKTKSKAQAEEIVQDIFLDLWNKHASLSIESVPKYLYTAIRYQALNKLRSQMVYQRYWEYYRAFIPQHETTTETTVYYHDLLHRIEERLDQLPVKTRKVFYMNKLEGKSLKEIANVLKLSEKAIEYHLSRSLKELRVYLRDSILLLFLFFM